MKSESITSIMAIAADLLAKVVRAAAIVTTEVLAVAIAIITSASSMVLA